MGKENHHRTKAYDEFTKLADPVFEEIYSNCLQDREIKERIYSELADRGSPASIVWKAEYDLGDVTKAINGCCHRSSKDFDYSGTISPASKCYQSYSFLREAGINCPKPIWLGGEVPRWGRWVFTENIPGKTIKEEIEESDDEGKKRIIYEVSDKVLDFMKKAGEREKKLEKEDKEKLFWSRDVERQAGDYLREISERKDIDDIVPQYTHLVGKVLKGDQVCHGDCNPSNMIRRDEEGHKKHGEIYFIDPELKKRNCFADMGHFFSPLWDFTGLWDGLVEKIKKGVGSELGDDWEAKARFELYSNILHYSLRRMAKRMKFENEKDDKPQRNIEYVLDSFTRDPKKFGLPQKERKIAEFLKKPMLNGRKRVCSVSNNNTDGRRLDERVQTEPQKNF